MLAAAAALSLTPIDCIIDAFLLLFFTCFAFGHYMMRALGSAAAAHSLVCWCCCLMMMRARSHMYANIMQFSNTHSAKLYKNTTTMILSTSLVSGYAAVLFTRALKLRLLDRQRSVAEISQCQRSLALSIFSHDQTARDLWRSIVISIVVYLYMCIHSALSRILISIRTTCNHTNWSIAPHDIKSSFLANQEKN